MKRRSFFGLLLAPIALPLLKLVEWVKPKVTIDDEDVAFVNLQRRRLTKQLNDIDGGYYSDVGNTTNNADLIFMDRNGMLVDTATGDTWTST